MSFVVGDILWFKEYTFTDTGESLAHFGLALLPETATRYQGSILCCVITSSESRFWTVPLDHANYSCFSRKSFACLNRKDLVSMRGLGSDPQPRGRLIKNDLDEVYKLLKKSLYCINDIASDRFMKGAIIRHWKKELGLIS